MKPTYFGFETDRWRLNMLKAVRNAAEKKGILKEDKTIFRSVLHFIKWVSFKGALRSFQSKEKDLTFFS